MKSIFLLPLLLLAITGTYAQQCNCKTSFEWVKKTFEENDAGFAHIVQLKGKDAYHLHNQLTFEKIKNITDVDTCISKLEDWVRFFRTDHFRFTKTQLTKDTSIHPPFHDIKRIEKEGGLVGRWSNPDYDLNIIQENNEYIGIITASHVPGWKPGDVRFKLATDLQSGTRYGYGYKPTPVKKAKIWAEEKNILQVDNIYLRADFMDYLRAGDDFFRVKTSRLPFGYKRDSGTVYIHINSFNYENKRAIDSVLKALHNDIVSTPNLIIDLRDCQGGTDGSFSKLIPYIYTNPIRGVLAEFYSTPLNNKMWTELQHREGLDDDEKATYKQIADLMNSKLGQYVNIFGKEVDVIKLNHVLPYPQNVGIIIHENNFSTTEEFILRAKQSRKVKFFGHKTGGALDVSNMVEAKEPAGNFIFEYCISRSLRIPDFPVDDMGLHPDFYLDKTIPETDWIDYTTKILNAK